MNPRTTAILFVIAVALGGFVYLYEIRGGAEREQTTTAEQRFFPGLAKDHVSSLRLRTSDGIEARIKRAGSLWKLVAPIEFPADEITVEAMLSTLVNASRETVIEDPQALETYGLGDEAGEIFFEAKGSEHSLRFGKETPFGGTRYVTSGGSTEVAILETHVVANFDRAFEELRDKRLLYFDRDAAKRIRLDWADGASVVLEKSAGVWKLSEPVEVLADAEVIETLLSDLSFLRASGFVDEPTAEQREDLEAPALIVELQTENENAEKGSFRVAFGSALDAFELRLAKTSQKSLYQVTDAVFYSIPQGVAEYRDKQLASFISEEVGSFRLILRDLGGELLEETGVVADHVWVTEPEEMQGRLAHDMVIELSRLRASAIIADLMGEETLAAFGLNPPRAEIQLYAGAPPTEGALLASFLIGNYDVREGIVVKLPESDIVYRIPFNLAKSIPLGLEAFRARFKVVEEPAAVEEPESPAEE